VEQRVEHVEGELVATLAESVVDAALAEEIGDTGVQLWLVVQQLPRHLGLDIPRLRLAHQVALRELVQHLLPVAAGELLHDGLDLVNALVNDLRRVRGLNGRVGVALCWHGIYRTKRKHVPRDDRHSRSQR
jgi:hypothetical protein